MLQAGRKKASDISHLGMSLSPLVLPWSVSHLPGTPVDSASLPFDAILGCLPWGVSQPPDIPLGCLTAPRHYGCLTALCLHAASIVCEGLWGTLDPTRDSLSSNLCIVVLFSFCPIIACLPIITLVTTLYQLGHAP